MNWNEYDDEQDYTMPCPHCREEIHDEAEQCPYCGQYITASTNPFASKPIWVQRLFIAIVIVTILAFVLPFLAQLF